MLIDAGRFDGPAGVYLSVVSPIYGCRDCLRELAARVEAAASSVTHEFELVLVDDASPDGSWSEIEQLANEYEWVRGYRLTRNFGQHSAIYAGLAKARGQWIVVMDCDLQHDPSVIPDLLATAKREKVEAVLTRRIDRQDGISKRIQSAVFNGTLQWLTGTRQDSSVALFGIYSRRVTQTVLAMPEQERAFPLMVSWTGFSKATVPVKHAERYSGTSSYNLGKLVRLASGIALSYSDKPLRLVAAGGILASMVAFTLALFAVFSLLTGRTTVAGFTSVVASIWLVGGAILLALGVVGLYIGQIFRNVQGRPMAIIGAVTKTVAPAAPQPIPSAERVATVSEGPIFEDELAVDNDPPSPITG